MERFTALLAAADRGLAGFEKALLAGLLAVAALLQFVQVSGRYLFQSSFSSLEEISVYLMIWLVFVGSVLCDRTQQHIVLDIAYHPLSDRYRRMLGRLRDAFQAILGLILAKVTLDAVLFSRWIGELSVSSLAMPIWIVMAVMPVAFLAIGLRGLFRVIGLNESRSIAETPEEARIE